MGAKNRKQDNRLYIVTKGNGPLPEGDYSIYIDSMSIQKGSMSISARVIETIKPSSKETGLEVAG